MVEELGHLQGMVFKINLYIKHPAVNAKCSINGLYLDGYRELLEFSTRQGILNK